MNKFKNIFTQMLKVVGIEGAKMQQGAAKAGDDTDTYIACNN